MLLRLTPVVQLLMKYLVMVLEQKMGQNAMIKY
jgi:hypothetical protein